MAAYRRMDGLKPPVHRDQLRAQRSVTSMGELYIYFYFIVLNWSSKKQVFDTVASSAYPTP